jgi:WD40 repeat protein
VALIDEGHRRGQRKLKALSARTLCHLPCPPVFHEGALATAVATRVDFRREAVRSLVALPQDRTKVICITDGRVASITLTQGAVGLVDTSVDSGEVTALIGHPNFHLVLTLSTADLILFDPVSGQGEVCRFEISSQEKVRCAVFPPNSSKLTVCSDVVDMFTVDVSTSFCKPAVSRDMKASITVVAWLNGDTTVVVASAQARVEAIVVLNTLTRHPVPVELRREMGGIVNGLEVEP